MIGIFGRAIYLKVIGICCDGPRIREDIFKFTDSRLKLLGGRIMGLFILIVGFLLGCLKDSLRFKW